MLQEKVMNQAMDKAKQLIKEKGEEKAREELKAFVSEKVNGLAASSIPGPLQKHAGKIIDSVCEKVVNQVMDKVKSDALGMKAEAK
jgi:hypothetical protein